jgi:hypothetical protein
MHQWKRMRRHNWVCTKCRYSNRTGQDCPTCGESTRRAYSRRIPQKHNDKAWKALAAYLAKINKLWWAHHRPEEAPPPAYDFGMHMIAKRNELREAKPVRPTKKDKPCERRRCYWERPCKKCRARIAVISLAALGS